MKLNETKKQFLDMDDEERYAFVQRYRLKRDMDMQRTPKKRTKSKKRGQYKVPRIYKKHLTQEQQDMIKELGLTITHVNWLRQYCYLMGWVTQESLEGLVKT